MTFLKEFLQLFQLDDISGVQQLRERLLRILLYSAAGIGTLLFSLSLIPALKGQLYVVLIFYFIYLLGFLAIAFLPHLSYRFRLRGWLFTLYIFGVVNLFLSGLNIDAGLFFLTYIVMTVLFFDTRRAGIALGVSLLTVVIMGVSVVSGKNDLDIGLQQTDPMLWVIGGTVLLLMGVVTSTSVSILLNGLAGNLTKVKRISSSLEEINKEVLEKEQHYRTLVETSPDAIIRVDLDGRIDAVNFAGEKLLALEKEKIVGKNINIFFNDSEWERVKRIFEDVLQKGSVRNADIVIRNFAGKNLYVEFSLAQIKDGNDTIIGLIGVAKDVTERKKAEVLLRQKTENIELSRTRLRSLTHELIMAQENERRIISRELHDDAGQALVTLKYAINALLDEADESCAPVVLRERLVKSLGFVEQAMATVRSASHRLRPPALDVGGINVGLDQLCREISEQTNLTIRYKGEDLEGISADLAISLYRFVQEAITNTLKHANAAKVEVQLRVLSDEIVLSVADDGQTRTDAEGQLSGVGLLGLQERFAHFSGVLNIEFSASQGCVITVCVPLAGNMVES